MKIAAALVAASAAVGAAQAADIQPLILGGTVVPAGTKTYTVGLRQTADGADFCGGALISPTHVLTAAHCKGYVKYVAVGTHYRSGSSDGVRVAVKREIPHPSYVASLSTYDYSVLELATPVTQYAPVKMLTADSETFVGSSATVMGWGRTTQGGSTSNELLRVNVEVKSDAYCKAADIQGYPISKTMFCAGGARNKDSCQGDSGGPIILEQATGDVLIGVVSWGEGCGLLNKPGVYSKVNVAKDWILANAPNSTFV